MQAKFQHAGVNLKQAFLAFDDNNDGQVPRRTQTDGRVRLPHNGRSCPLASMGRLRVRTAVSTCLKVMDGRVCKPQSGRPRPQISVAEFRKGIRALEMRVIAPPPPAPVHARSRRDSHRASRAPASPRGFFSRVVRVVLLLRGRCGATVVMVATAAAAEQQ